MKAIGSTIAALLFACAAHADISVNFTESGTPTHANQQIPSNTVAGVFQRTNWNNTTNGITGTLGALVDSSGAATAASINWSCSNVWRDGAAAADATAGVGDALLAHGYLDDGTPGVNLTVSSVPYASYTAVLYLCTGADGGSYLPFSVNGSDYSASGTKHNYENPNWDASNTIIVEGLSGNLAVVGQIRDGVLRGSIGGLQIIEETAGALPGILAFSSSSTNVLPGSTVTLSWMTHNATGLSIDQSIGAVTGMTSTQVVVNADTTYTLTASNGNGDVTESVTVTIDTSLPTINTFTANKTVVNSGDTVTLSWNVDNATSLSLNQGIGDVTGATSTQVVVNAETIYTLTAGNPNGSTNESLTITIGEVSPLVAYWNLEEGTGTNTTEQIASIVSAGFPAGATWTNNVAAPGSTYSLAFADGGRLETKRDANSLGIAGSGEKTILAWINTTTTAEDAFLGYSPSNGGGAGADLRFLVKNGGLRMEVSAGGFEIGSGLNDGTWHMVAFIVNAGDGINDVDVYIDGTYTTRSGGGTLINTQGAMNNIPINGDGFVLGSDGNASRHYTGLLDDVGIYDKALTEAELDEIFADGVIPSPAVPVTDLTISGPVSGGTGMVLSWTGENGKTYAVQTNSNLIVANWQDFATGLGGAAGTVSVTNTIGPDQTFYRVISE